MKRIILILLFIANIFAYGQTFSVFNLDTTNFPIMKAEFYAFDSSGVQISNLNTNDFEIFENGIPRKIRSISCTDEKNKVAISLLFGLDISTTMGAEKGGASPVSLGKYFIQTLASKVPMPPSEYALQGCNAQAHVFQHFSSIADSLGSALKNINGSGGTNYVEMLLNKTDGLFNYAAKGKFKRIVVFFGDANFPPLLNSQVQECADLIKKNKITFYAMICNSEKSKKPDSRIALASLAQLSGGEAFYNINFDTDMIGAALRILNKLNLAKPCTIEWESDYLCKPETINIVVKSKRQKLDSKLTYKSLEKSILGLDITPNLINFKDPIVGGLVTQTVKVKAINRGFRVLDINSSNSSFNISPKAFYVQKDQTIDLTVSYVPEDSSYDFTNFEIIGDSCNAEFSAVGGYVGAKPSRKILKLVFPNGGEKFIVGTDSIIKWSGISDMETVNIHYSVDGGLNWKEITNNATKLNYIWKNIPKPPSDKCLVKVSQNIVPEDYSSKYVALNYLGHNNPVVDVKWSPTGLYVASVDIYGNTKIWDYQTGKTIYSFYTDYSYTSYSLKWNALGDKLIVLSSRTISVFDLKIGKILKTLTGHSGDIYCASWEPGGSKIASCSYDKTVKLFDLDLGIVFYNATDHTDVVNYVEYSPDGKYLVSASSDKSAVIRQGLNASKIRSLIGHRAAVLQARFNSNATKVVTASADSTAIIWDANTGSIDFTLKGHRGPVTQAIYSKTGNKIYTVSTDSCFIVWDAATGSQLLKIDDIKSKITAFTELKDPNYVVICSSDNLVTIYNLNTGKTIQQLYGHKNRISAVTYSPFGDDIATSSLDNSVKVWQIDEGANVLKQDVSDNLFTIIAPTPITKPIDMKECTLGLVKDSIITEMVINQGICKFRVDSIYFTGDDASSFYLLKGYPKYYLEQGAFKSASIAFTPYKLGLHSAQCVVITQSDTLVQDITGTGVEPVISLVNNSINFGNVEVGKYKDTVQVLTIKNQSDCDVYINFTKHDKPNDIDFTTIAGKGPFTLKAHESQAMTLRFKPSKVGQTSGTLNFYFNGDGSPASIALYGEGVDSKPNISVLPVKIDNLICNWENQNDLSIKNESLKEIIVNKIELSGINSSDFSINAATPFTVNIGDSTKIPIKFKPAGYGEKSAKLIVYSNSNPDSIITVDIAGVKEKLELSPSVYKVDIGNICPGEIVDTLISISNTGSIKYYGGIITSPLINCDKIINLDVNESRAFPFKFIGSNLEGPIDQTIVIKDTLCGNETKINIIGSVSSPQINAQNLVFTCLNGKYKEEKLKISNDSKTTAVISEITGIKYPFSFNSLNLPIVIEPGSYEELIVRYDCDDYQKDSLNLTININPCNVNQSVKLLGLPSSVSSKLYLNDNSAYSGDIIEIPIYLTNANELIKAGINYLDFDLSFNSSLLYALDYPNIPGNGGFSKIEIKKIPVNNKVGVILTNIKFKVGLGDAETTKLIVDNLKSYDGVGDFEIVSGIFKLLGVCREGGVRLINPNSKTSINSIRPNPANDELIIDFNLGEKDETSILLVDELGKIVKEIKTTFKENNESISIKLKLDDISSGTYSVILKTPTIILKKAVTIIK